VFITRYLHLKRKSQAATRDGPILRGSTYELCLLWSQVATSSGSKRTDPEMRKDRIRPLAAIDQ
jgi:hypothetical protein